MRTRVRLTSPWSSPTAAPLCLLSAILVAVVPVPLWAGDWYVDDDGDCVNGNGSQGNPFCKIQDAIDASLDGDTVHIAPGTYFERVVVDRNLRLIGTEGADVTAIDAGASGRGLTIDDGLTAEVEGLTITNGSALAGGGVRIKSGATVTLSNSTVRANFARQYGGGIDCYNARSVTMLNTVIRDNYARELGGGIHSRHNENRSVNLKGCTITGNVAYFGGGVANHVGGTVTLRSCSINGNRVSEEGAGIWNRGHEVALKNCSVDGNLGGSAIYNRNGIDDYPTRSMVTIDNCTVNNNQRGIMAYYFGQIILSNSTVNGSLGNGIAVYTATVTISNSTIRGNDGYGIKAYYGKLTAENTLISSSGWSGIRADFTNLSLSHCTISGNQRYGLHWWAPCLKYDSCSSDVDHTIMAGNGVADCGDLMSGGYNLIGDTKLLDIHGDETGNLYDIDPLFADPDGPDDDPDTWQDNDWSLQPTSPSVDAGSPALWLQGQDLAGNPRQLDGDLDHYMIVDMGAYEFNNVHLDITGDTTPGGILTVETSGTPSLLALLLFSTQSGEQLLYPYGSLFVGAPFQFFPLAVIPDTRDIMLPGDAPVGMEFWVQELAVDLFSGAGNFSNPVKLVIE